jgi:L-alanine-DL-glutamate epimerase-like enolase superfamily enzyme
MVDLPDPDGGRTVAVVGSAIILDESVTKLADLEALHAGPAYVLNARVSKHGGLLRTLDVIRDARARGIKIIVGSQVGETSILARAGIVAARAAGPDLIGFEGAFGTRLLARDAATPLSKVAFYVPMVQLTARRLVVGARQVPELR